MELDFGKDNYTIIKFTHHLFVVVPDIMKLSLLLKLMVLTQKKLPLLKLEQLLMKLPLTNHGVLEISSFISLDVLKLVSNVMVHQKVIAQNVKTTGLSKMVNVFL